MSGINEFLVFDENNQNSLTNEAYSIDEQRLNGVESGIARSSLYNKALRQSTTMVNAIAQVMADRNIDAKEDSTIKENVEKLLKGDGIIPPGGDILKSSGMYYVEENDKTSTMKYLENLFDICYPGTRACLLTIYNGTWVIFLKRVSGYAISNSNTTYPILITYNESTKAIKEIKNRQSGGAYNTTYIYACWNSQRNKVLILATENRSSGSLYLDTYTIGANNTVRVKSTGYSYDSSYSNGAFYMDDGIALVKPGSTNGNIDLLYVDYSGNGELIDINISGIATRFNTINILSEQEIDSTYKYVYVAHGGENRYQAFVLKINKNNKDNVVGYCLSTNLTDVVTGISFDTSKNQFLITFILEENEEDNRIGYVSKSSLVENGVTKITTVPYSSNNATYNINTIGPLIRYYNNKFIAIYQSQYIEITSITSSSGYKSYNIYENEISQYPGCTPYILNGSVYFISDFKSKDVSMSSISTKYDEYFVEEFLPFPVKAFKYKEGQYSYTKISVKNSDNEKISDFPLYIIDTVTYLGTGVYILLQSNANTLGMTNMITIPETVLKKGFDGIFVKSKAGRQLIALNGTKRYFTDGSSSNIGLTDDYIVCKNNNKLIITSQSSPVLGCNEKDVLYKVYFFKFSNDVGMIGD